MKKLSFLLALSLLTLVSCSDAKKKAPKVTKESKTERVAKVEKATLSTDALAGKKLFNSSGCTACHHETSKIIGPAVKIIATSYLYNDKNILKFLKGKAEAIVEKDPGQVAIMKSNLDTMVKDISDEDLTSITIYIASVK